LEYNESGRAAPLPPPRCSSSLLLARAGADRALPLASFISVAMCAQLAAAGALLVLVTAAGLAQAQDPELTPLVEPYPLLQGADPAGAPPVPTSPDPLVRTTWSAATNITGLQRYEKTVPVAWVADPPSAFSGLETLGTATPNVLVKGAGSLRLDFGGEHPAWFEFSSPDLAEQLDTSTILASISEYNEPWNGKTQKPKAYAGGKYRLETNPQLYEGVRYAWIFFDAQPTAIRSNDGEEDEETGSGAVKPWHITGVKIVSQVKPVNYTGSFNSSDDTLTGSWYSGAYGSKVNMMPYGFNSILMDRGARTLFDFCHAAVDTFYTRTECLPRQARDKHRKSGQKDTFLQATASLFRVMATRPWPLPWSRSALLTPTI
jgi:hypothetical protein